MRLAIGFGRVSGCRLAQYKNARSEKPVSPPLPAFARLTKGGGAVRMRSAECGMQNIAKARRRREVENFPVLPDVSTYFLIFPDQEGEKV